MERQDWWKGRRPEYVIPYILFRQFPFYLEIVRDVMGKGDG